jgi:hypothetical protein
MLGAGQENPKTDVNAFRLPFDDSSESKTAVKITVPNF